MYQKQICIYVCMYVYTDIHGIYVDADVDFRYMQSCLWTNVSIYLSIYLSIYQVFLGRPNQSHAKVRSCLEICVANPLTNWIEEQMSLWLFNEKTISKINQKSSKNCSWEVPGGARGPSRSLPGASRHDFWDTTEIFEEFEAFRARPGAHLGTQPGPAGTQKSTKNGLMAKKTASGSVTGSVFHWSSMQTSF